MMTLEVDCQSPVGLLEDQAAGRAALLGVEAVGDGPLHDALGPLRPEQFVPVGAAPHAPHAATQSTPKGVLPHQGPPLLRLTKFPAPASYPCTRRRSSVRLPPQRTSCRHRPARSRCPCWR